MHVNTPTVPGSPCRRCLALNLTQEVHSHLRTWHTLTSRHACMDTQKKKHMLFSSYKLAGSTVCAGLHCSVTCDCMRTGCSDPVSRPGFISSCSTVLSTSHCQKTLRENQTDSQLDRKRSSKGVRGCWGWFMPWSGMLNEFRVHCCYGNWLNGHCFAFSVTYSYSLNGNSQNVKMGRYCPRLISHGTSNTSWGRQRRKWITAWPQSEFLVSALTASAQRQSWATCWRLVAKQKWKTLICITALLNHSKQKFLRVTSTSDMTLSACASFRGLCASVAIPHIYVWTANHSDIRKPQSLSVCCLNLHLSVLLSVSVFAFVSQSKIRRDLR